MPIEMFIHSASEDRRSNRQSACFCNHV